MCFTNEPFSVSGQNEYVFHYDSDEGIDFSAQDVPMVHPLLSTVTYLTDAGEPTMVRAYILILHDFILLVLY